MEYGSITVIGLPSTWPILIDSKLTQVELLIVGGGLVKSKMRLPGKMLEQLPNAIIIENLGKSI
jgi:prolyl-tRNA editing enzyme YbaK/EbsC (Cys-tRNA(Pro) deacylase)